MAATINGLVFNDINANGVLDLGEPGIAGCEIVLLRPDGTCLRTTTDGNGIYSFGNLTQVGTYTVYETAIVTFGCPPSELGQPSGFNISTTKRIENINVTSNNISSNAALTSSDFGHADVASFTCKPVGYQIEGTGSSDFSEINLVTGEVTIISSLGIQVNALGYNPVDNFIYAMNNDKNPSELVRIYPDGTTASIGAIPNLPNSSFNNGTFDEDGHYYIYNSDANRFYVIDLDPTSATYGQLVDPATGFTLDTSPFGTSIASRPILDWSYSPVTNFLYAVNPNNGNVLEINPITGDITTLNTTGLASTNYGATFLDSNGIFYAIRNNTGRVDKVTISGNTATAEQFSQALASGNNDGASCINVPIEVDYGDAPDTSGGNGSGNYTTLLANDGPRHQVISGLTLGTQITGENDALQNGDATGDDIFSGIQDDGVNVPINIDITQATYTMSVSVTNTTGEDANVYGWVDFNDDGIFQTEEGATAVVSSLAGLQNIDLVYNIPVGTTIGTTFARIRLTTDNLINTGGSTDEDTRSFGPASDGEVEDYIVTLTDQPVTSLAMSKSVDQADALTGDTLLYTVTIRNTGLATQNDIVFVDAIPSGTTYVANSISADVAFTGNNPENGIIINSLAPGEIATITWEVTIGDTVPNPNPVPNSGSITTQDSTVVDSNVVATDVRQSTIAITPQKSVDKVYAGINDVITYTVELENTGNVTLNDVLFTDPIPAGTVYANNLSVSTTFTGTDPQTGITISTMDPGDIVTISWDIQVDGDIPSSNPIINIGTISLLGEEDLNTNSTSTQVNNAVLDSTKSVDKIFVEVGDTLTYSIDITNDGNVNANNVVITDAVPSGTSLVPGSISANVAFTTGLPNVTGNLTNPIGPGETITVTFDVTVDTIPTTNPIPNSADIDYSFTIDPANPNSETNSLTTNTVLTQAKNVDVTVDKSADKQTAIVGETITYTINVDNNGNTDLDPAIITDIIPPGTTYVNGTLLVNGALNPSDPNSGIDISPLNALQSKTIVFDVTVDENASPLPLENTAILNYEYLIDPTDPPIESSESSNTVDVDVADVDIVKTVNKEFVAVGDTLTFSTTITNIGNAPIENLIFTDAPPPNTTYVDPSLNINGTLYPSLDPNSPIDLGSEVASLFPLPPGNSITISYRVSIDSLPTSPLITNTSSVEYEYLDGSTTQSSIKDSNEVSAEVRDGEVVVTKSADKTVVEVGDTLTYTITLENTGNIPVDNVVLSDIIPPETEFVMGSVIVNNVARPTDNPASGINVGTIDAQEIAIVVFSVIVNTLPISGEITNQASATYEVSVDPTVEPITENRESNEIITQVERIEVVITKSTDTDKAIIGDTITYTFTIINTGTVDVTNIKFFDILPSEVEFVDGSFIGSTQGSVVASDLITGVDIGDLAVGEQKNISFEVILLQRPAPPVIINTATLTYEYELVQGETLTKGSQSNESIVDVLSISFKQDSIDGKFTIPCQKPDIESIIDLQVTPIVTNLELINSPKGISQDGQTLTGKKLLVCITFCMKVIYVAQTCKQTVHSAHKEVSICAYAVVPENTDIEVCSDPNILIEDIYYLELNPRDLFFNITYLLDTGL